MQRNLYCNILFSVFVIWVGFGIFSDPPPRMDCLPQVAQLEHWFSSDLVTVQTKMSSLNGPLSDRKLQIIDECLLWIGANMSEAEIEEWRSESCFRDHYAKIQLLKTCSLYNEIASLESSNSKCNAELVRLLSSQIPNSMQQLRFWLNIWNQCQIDSHMFVCKMSRKNSMDYDSRI